MNRDGRTLPVGPLIAALGALLLAVSLFLDWWDGVTAFTAYELLDLVLLALAVWTIAALAGGLGLVRPALSPGVSLAVALVTIAIVVSQVLNDPPAIVGSERDYDVGIWLALAGAALMVVGALLAYARISLAVDVRPREAGERPAPPASEAPTRSGPAQGGPERP
jgi:hypothetical protein